MVSSKDSKRKITEVQWLVALTWDTHRGSSPFNKKRMSNIRVTNVSLRKNTLTVFSLLSVQGQEIQSLSFGKIYVV